MSSPPKKPKETQGEENNFLNEILKINQTKKNWRPRKKFSTKQIPKTEDNIEESNKIEMRKENNSSTNQNTTAEENIDKSNQIQMSKENNSSTNQNITTEENIGELNQIQVPGENHKIKELEDEIKELKKNIEELKLQIIIPKGHYDQENTKHIWEAAEIGSLPAVLYYYINKINAIEAVKPLDKMTPMHYAAINGHINILDFLIKKKAKVDPLNAHGETPLMMACFHGRVLAVDYLLDNGAVIANTNENKYNPLHFAVFNGHLHVVKLLVQRKAGIFYKNAEGQTPLQMAKAMEWTEIFEYLNCAIKQKK